MFGVNLKRLTPFLVVLRGVFIFGNINILFFYKNLSMSLKMTLNEVLHVSNKLNKISQYKKPIF